MEIAPRPVEKMRTKLPNDTALVEPGQPMVGSLQERALTHVHAPARVCSGVILGKKLVATAHQCVGDAVQGVRPTPKGEEFYVEVASSSFTWTRRTVVAAVVAGCEWERLDIALLVLSEPMEWVKPLRIIAVPQTGFRAQALGFGQCGGTSHGVSERVGQVLRRENAEIEVDVPLCSGDVGGPLVDPVTGDLLGLISHQNSPTLRSTTIMRLDTSPVHALLQQAAAVAAEPGKAFEPVSCE